MKTLSILFSEPNMFSVLPNDFPKGMCVYSDACNSGITCKCEQSKANVIRIENPELFEHVVNPSIFSDYDELQAKSIWYKTSDGAFFKDTNDQLKSGDIFQVEGFEYEVKVEQTINVMSSSNHKMGPYKKVAILKLAKEEEPKEPIYPKCRTKDTDHCHSMYCPIRGEKVEQKEQDDLHNRIMVQWEKDYGSIHSEQIMDAYTVSGFIHEILKLKSKS